jgi:U3 small nucleolar RNA-associated protein 24
LVKRIIAKKDARLAPPPAPSSSKPQVRQLAAPSSSLFFAHNASLKPPYTVLVDTNFINFSIQNKLEMVKAMMDCLLAKCTPAITDCVMAELEKMGEKYRVALRYTPF